MVIVIRLSRLLNDLHVCIIRPRRLPDIRKLYEHVDVREFDVAALICRRIAWHLFQAIGRAVQFGIANLDKVRSASFIQLRFEGDDFSSVWICAW